MSQLGIVLEPDEQALFDQLEFDQAKVTVDTYETNAELALALFRKLSARGIIPEHRRRWFTDADCNPGGRGRSRMQRWAENGTRGDEVIRHPNFLAHLRYFVRGPDLPAAVIAEFAAEAERCGRITSSDIPMLSDAARTIARAHHLEPLEASNEFYKLALEFGLPPHRCVSFRDKVRAIRYTRQR